MSKYVTFVNRQNLRIARENVGYSTMQSTQKVAGTKTKKDKVAEWEKESNNPTWKQLEHLARIYGINLFLLTSKEAITPNREIPDFRKMSADINKEQIKKYIHFLLMRQIFLEDQMKATDSQKNHLVGLGASYKDPEKLAHFISEKIGYLVEEVEKEKDKLKYFRSLIEENNIFVMKTLAHKPIRSVEEMRGMYIRNEYAPIIAINRRDAKTAQMFTLAHELAHLFLNKEGITNITSGGSSTDYKIEAFCNRVAANLLLPKRVIENKEYDLLDIKNLAKRYGVSPLAAFYRLKELEHIEGSDVSSIKNILEQEMRENVGKKDKKGGGNFINSMKDTNGGLFNRFVLSLYSENKINAFGASKVLGVSIDNF